MKLSKLGFIKQLLVVIFIILIAPLLSSISAQDFTTDYQVEYFLSETDYNINSKVDFKIIITNLKSDVYVNKFSISFPKAFSIKFLKVSDDRGEVEPNIIYEPESTKIEMEFQNPFTGKGSVNTFRLQFEQNNLFKINGNVWEVMLPVVENKKDSSYKVVVNLPPNNSKKISISKPIPTLIQGSQITWVNPSTRTIYAVFGNSQVYKTNLTYNLKNFNITPTSYKVVFPPDTLYQKIYINKLNYKPDLTYQDEDGNLIASYFLKPLETKIINLDLFIEVFSHPQEEIIPVVRERFTRQKKYLLNAEKYWQIDDSPDFSEIKTVEGVYNYVVSKLRYNYLRISSDNTRMGATAVLSQPELAVCMEFTDLFVALCRDKGIYAREIEGYANSSDPELRPLSLSSDILHAWPEYYDENQGIWKSVDPTWQNTSGIDYLSSFDLNHIVFVIHGKKSDYPYPAGMYKIEDSKDIIVNPVNEKGIEDKKINISRISFPNSINNSKKYEGELEIINTSNVYVYNTLFKISSENIIFNNSEEKILSLAPYEKKLIKFSYKVKDNSVKTKDEIKIYINKKEVYKANIKIIPKIIETLILVLLIILIVITVFFISKKIKK